MSTNFMHLYRTVVYIYIKWDIQMFVLFRYIIHF